MMDSKTFTASMVMQEEKKRQQPVTRRVRSFSESFKTFSGRLVQEIQVLLMSPEFLIDRLLPHPREALSHQDDQPYPHKF